MEKSKNTFGSKLGFILAAAGSAVGLGNIWRFPYLVGRYGGGAFVLVYLLAVLLLGSVVMITEMYIGRRAKTNIVNSYGKANKWLKWIGMLGVIVPFVISTYYAVIGGWASGYAVEYLINPELVNNPDGFFGSFITSPIAIVFFALFLAATLLIVCGGVQKGIEKASKIMMPALFVLLLVVIVYVMTLPGKGEGHTVLDGLKFYMGQFNFAALGWDGVLAAMGQAFYSLSLGMGVMVSYGSYTGKDTNLGKSALTVCGLDTLVALLAGFAIFPGMFATGASLESIKAAAGPGLLFDAMAKVFSQMGAGAGSIIGFFFFTFVIFAALTSLMSLVEVVSQYTLEKYNWSRTKATLVFGGIIGLIGLFVCIGMGWREYSIFGFSLLDYFDMVTNQVLMPIIAFAGCVTVGYVIKPKQVFSELDEMGSSFKGQKFWLFLNMFVTPALLLVVWVMGLVDNFNAETGFGASYGWVLGGSLVLMAATFVWNVLLENKKFQTWKTNKQLVEEAAVAEYTDENDSNSNTNTTCNCGCDKCENNDATKGAD